MSKKISVWLLGWLLAVVLGLWGCGLQQLAEGELKPPQVTFEALHLNPPTCEEWPLACTLLLDNPNPQPLKIQGFDYELWIEGQRLVQGESLEALNLPAQGQAKVVVPLLIKLPGIPKVLGALLQKPKIAYEIAGSVRLGPGMGLLKLPFRFQGQITQEEGWDQLQQFLKTKT
ncbi:MAG: LEA type 2 family protein [Desulfobacca sp.]|nr:LEA type 2 family protein [Desulfobacca sp.]